MGDRLWLLRGDLDSIESAIAWYIQTWGQHLPGVAEDHTAGVPTATANMAMSVIRKNVKPLPREPHYVDEAVMEMLASDREEAEGRAWEAEQALDEASEWLLRCADALLNAVPMTLDGEKVEGYVTVHITGSFRDDVIAAARRLAQSETASSGERPTPANVPIGPGLSSVTLYDLDRTGVA